MEKDWGKMSTIFLFGGCFFVWGLLGLERKNGLHWF
jgi:hypothetical protein